jgi:deoxyribodipyrimidine photo-lyase
VQVQDNWAMLFAQKVAMANNLPLHVIDCLSVTPDKHPEATLRVFDFVTKALAEIESECRDLNIGFHVLTGPSPADNLVKFMDEYKVLRQRVYFFLKKNCHLFLQKSNLHVKI